nr:hypothetical protein [Tanacetum cinerariifolium]
MVLSHYGSDVLAEVYNPDNIDKNMINQSVQAISSFEQSSVMNHSKTKITSDSNIILYSQYVYGTQQAAVQNLNSSAQQDICDRTTKNPKRYKEQVKGLKEGQNVELEPKLYDGNVIKNTYAIMIPNSEETQMLAEESHSKTTLKLQDPMVLEKKVNTKPFDYTALNQLSQDFEKQFVSQTELSAEQAFWSQNSMNSSDPSPSCTPIRVEVP